MSNWIKAVNAAIEEQAENGIFNSDGEMLICHDDPEETFRVMADHLDPDTMQDWLINNQDAMELMLDAIRSQATAQHWMQRIRKALGREILNANRQEIEALASRNAKQYAHDAYWDSRMEDMRDLG